MDAGKLIEEFYKEGSYQELKVYEKHLDDLKVIIREELQQNNEIRYEFKDIGYVAKWRKVPKYETDYPSLNEYLHNLGLLIPSAKITYRGLPEDVKLDLTPFELPSEWSVGLYPNKKGRVTVEPLPIGSIDKFNLNKKMRMYAKMDREKQFVSIQYENLKKQMLNCPVLKEEKKIMHEYGSVSLKEKKTGYDLESILEWLGEEFLIECAKPNHEKLEEYIVRGIIQQSDIQTFRRVVDIRLDFMIQTVDSENRMLDFFAQKRNNMIEMSLIS